MATKKISVVSDPRSGLLPDPRVADRYRKTTRTIDNWARQPALGFPRAVRINGRKYRRIAELEAWERQQRVVA
jgi:hypothetical protein